MGYWTLVLKQYVRARILLSFGQSVLAQQHITEKSVKERLVNKCTVMPVQREEYSRTYISEAQPQKLHRDTFSYATSGAQKKARSHSRPG